MATKEDIIAQLQDAGVEHDPTAKKADLEALLPQTDATPAAAPTDTPAATPAAKSDRQVRWEAFLERARAQRPEGAKAVFDEQKARGEFDQIPDTFL